MTARRILIIDDEADILELTQLTLQEGAGWEVQTAATGREGLAKAAAALPDAILLDVLMPDLDGPSTFAALQADPGTRPIPVILLTAVVEIADRRRFKQLGVAGTISKPYRDLAGQIRVILGWSA